MWLMIHWPQRARLSTPRGTQIKVIDEAMKPDTHKETSSRKQLSMTRRALLGSAAALSAAVAFAPHAFAHAVSAHTRFEFLHLSEILTAKRSLDPEVAVRAFDCLTAEDPSFSGKASALAQHITEAGFSDMRTFNQFLPSAQAEMRATAMKIISAWYLGYTGRPAMDSTVDDARFVTYTQALMYQPTIDATVIPSFSRGHTNYWSTPPSTLATD